MKERLLPLWAFYKESKRDQANRVTVLKSPADTDLHLVLVSKPTDSESLSITAEITPRVRAKGHPNFVIEKLKPIEGQLVRVTGLLMLDTEHIELPLRRATNWEIHPVLKLEVCTTGDHCKENIASGWKSIDDLP